MVTLDALIADVVGQLIDDKLDRLKAELPDVIIERLKTDYSPDDLLNTVQVAKFLRVSPQTVRNWQKQGLHLPYHLNKDKVFYRYSDVVEFKKSLAGKRIIPKR